MQAYLKRPKTRSDDEEDIKILDEPEDSIDASPTNGLNKGFLF